MPPRLDEATVLDALRPIVDPDFGKSIVDLGFVKDLRIEAGRVEFAALFAENESRPFIIATFVGLLEMIKLGVVDVEQSANCGEIYLSLTAEHVDDALLVLSETYEARVPLAQTSEEGANDAGR